MGEIADMMLGGVLCAHCGAALNCAISNRKDSCEEMGIPMFGDIECAKDGGAGIEQVCPHK